MILANEMIINSLGIFSQLGKSTWSKWIGVNRIFHTGKVSWENHISPTEKYKSHGALMQLCFAFIKGTDRHL